MAKQRKKRKYTKRNKETNYFDVPKLNRRRTDKDKNPISSNAPQSVPVIGLGTTTTSGSGTATITENVVIRASSTSYTFINGNKVLLRNLTDEQLNERYEQTVIAGYEARRNSQLLEKMQYNMSMEQRFRGLK